MATCPLRSSPGEFSNWLRRVIWGRILRGRHHGTRLWNNVDAKWLWRILQSSCLFSVFSNINGEHESTLTTSKKYSWCIPVQNVIKPIIWGAAITPEPWNRQQCWFIFGDPNVRVARLLESLATIIHDGCSRKSVLCQGLNYFGLLMPYGVGELGQLWFGQWHVAWLPELMLITINEITWHSFQGNVYLNTQDINLKDD